MTTCRRSTGSTSRRGRCAAATSTRPGVHAQPSENQRRHASTTYDQALEQYTAIIVSDPDLTGAPRNFLRFPFFGQDPNEIVTREGTFGDPMGLLERAHLKRTYALARELARDADSPEEYVERVLAYLADGSRFTYSETPPAAARTLDGFLFDARQGYCQQYSGAMALLLRMAGIPARVSTGFSTGATDTKTGEYVVRDFDAHSWVEVYYPGYGWVTFDPTPAASPARSQPADAVAVRGSASRAGPVTLATALSERGGGVLATADSGAWWRYPLLVLAALALAGSCSSASAAGATAPRRPCPSSSARCGAPAAPGAGHDAARAGAAVRAAHAGRRRVRPGAA